MVLVRRTRSFVYPRVEGTRSRPDGGSSRGNVFRARTRRARPSRSRRSRLPVKSVSSGKTATRTGRAVRACAFLEQDAKDNKQRVKPRRPGVYHKRIYPFRPPFATKTLRVDAGFSSFCCWFSAFFFVYLAKCDRRREPRRRHDEIGIRRNASGVCTGPTAEPTTKSVLGNKLNSRPKSVSMYRALL